LVVVRVAAAFEKRDELTAAEPDHLPTVQREV
jgi:hypothetical protein